jgi:chemotaxis protein methyltransferase CheR
MIQPGVMECMHSVIAKRLGSAVNDMRSESLLAAVRRLPAMLGAETIEHALRLLQELPLESPAWQHIVDATVIGETRFLRQPDWFGEIARLALAPLIAQRRSDGILTLRCWSAGCSTGEEAYTLAMILHDLLPDFSAWKIDILASDIHVAALLQAAEAIYSERQLREVDADRISRYFEPTSRGGDRYQVVGALRNIVRFSQASLIEDACQLPATQGGQFDLIICRNVLIYMTPANQRAIARHLSHMLRPEGWLAVSPTEAMAEWFKDLTPVNTSSAILFHRPKSSRRVAPTMTSISHSPAQRSTSPDDKRDPSLPLHRSAAQRSAKSATYTTRSMEQWLIDIRSLADRGQLTEAKQRCLRLIGGDALNGDAKLLLAEIYTELGDIRLAVEAARQAIYLAPSSPMAHFLLGNNLAKQGHRRKAQQAMRIALSLAQAGNADTPVTSYSEMTHGHLCAAATTFLRHQADLKSGEASTHA